MTPISRELITFNFQSGVIRGEEAILEGMHEAIVEAFGVGISKGWKRLEPEVAKLTGNMRRNMRIKLRALVKKKIKSSRGVYELTRDDIRRTLSRALSYAKFHVREGSYKFPSTPGTKPISRAQLEKLTDYIEDEIRLNLPRGYKRQGLDV